VAWCVGVAVVCAAVGVTLPRIRAYHVAPDVAGGEPHRAWRAVVVDRRDSADAVMLRARVTNGPHRGITFSDAIRTDAIRPASAAPRTGDGVLCHVEVGDGAAHGQASTRIRETPLLVLTGVFLALLGLVGGAKGRRTAFGLVAALAAVACFLLPAACAVWDPVLTAVPVAAGIAAAGIPLITGANRKALSAILGTTVGAAAAGTLAVIACRLLGYTGLAIDFGPQFNLDVAYWYSRPLARVDFAGLLAAGMLISVLGATMDVSVGVASAAAEVRAGAPGASRRRVALAGLAVGRHMLGTMAVTLFFIYVGSGLMLYVALSSTPSASTWFALLNHEEVGAEVVRLLAGAIGMAAAVPVTALCAGMLVRGGPNARP